jgi:Type IV secretory pathway, protease TraF
MPLALTGFGLACLAFAALKPAAPLLVWNASASAPIGFYRVVAAPPVCGALVLARPPTDVGKLAAARGYLPAGVPLVKRVAALTGDTVCAAGNTVSINGTMVAIRLEHDTRGRPLPRWQGCRTLAEDELFLLMAGVPDSFDGRYFGPVPAASIIGRLVPLWAG